MINKIHSQYMSRYFEQFICSSSVLKGVDRRVASSTMDHKIHGWRGEGREASGKRSWCEKWVGSDTKGKIDELQQMSNRTMVKRAKGKKEN